MSITYTWTINAMDAYPQYEGQEDVVFTVHWTLNGTDGTHNGSVYGTVGVTYDPATPFVPFSNLTQDQVIGWVTSALGTEQVTSLEENIASQIENQINPKVISPTLPWDK